MLTTKRIKQNKPRQSDHNILGES